MMHMRRRYAHMRRRYAHMSRRDDAYAQAL